MDYPNNSNNNIGKDFLAMPKPHHHVSRLLVLVIILLVIMALSAVYLIFSSGPTVTPVLTTPSTTHQMTASEFNRLNTNPNVKPTPITQAQMKAFDKANKKKVTSTKPSSTMTAEQFNLLNKK